MPSTLLLDLDGTLVNSVPDLAACLNRLMAARGLAGFTEAETAEMVGDGVERLVERGFAARGIRPQPADIAAYVTDYGAHYADQTRLYPGVAETLAELREAGWRLAVCTNKLTQPARALLQALGIDAMCDAVAGSDSVPARKPDPRHLLAALAAAGGLLGKAVMAGDHRNDIAAAHAAGMPGIFAAWGYGTAAMAEGADAVAADFDELPMLAERLLACRTRT
jgi:phosphoglycolate phosphatase